MVHPHACGELLLTGSHKKKEDGSSPRMWGTLFFYRCRIAVDWFIPTHVGNSPSSWFFFTSLLVHPHACGELLVLDFLRRFSVGSSPRMWGTHVLMRRDMSIVWFIPTHVGNSFELFDHTTTILVHPHACGELAICRISR